MAMVTFSPAGRCGVGAVGYTPIDGVGGSTRGVVGTILSAKLPVAEGTGEFVVDGASPRGPDLEKYKSMS
jgi:hypothetical protein